MWTKQSRRPGRIDAMLRSVVLCRIVPCGPRQQGGERHALNRICAKAKLARPHGEELSCFLPGKDGFRAPAHGIPGVMRVSPCGTRG